MSLSDILREDYGIVRKEAFEDIDRDRIVRDLPRMRELISFWRAYPDIFIDYLCGLNPHNTFHFFYYQRVSH